MGGYGAFVWPAYGLTVLAFAVMAVWSLLTLTSRRRQEKDLAALRRPRRADRATQP
jgi:heme exporter protein CcmD